MRSSICDYFFVINYKSRIVWRIHSTEQRIFMNSRITNRESRIRA